MRLWLATSGHVSLTRLISIDPRFAIACNRPTPHTVLRQYLTGETYSPRGPRPGFEYMPLERWKNEHSYHKVHRNNRFAYLHNHVMPVYALRLGTHT